MSRYIDADALIKAMCSNCALFLDKTCDGNRISCYPSSIVREQPTVDAVPVVRCGECKKWGSPIPIEMKEKGYGYCGGLWTNTHENEYCAWGKRRTE